jgi:hypothetical protein
MSPSESKAWVDLGVAAIGAFFGTLAGALIALRSDRSKRKKEKEDRILTAANLTMFQLGRLFTYLWNYQEGIIEPHALSPLIWYEIPRAGLAAPDFGIMDFSSLSFLFESAEPNLPNSVALQFVRYDGLLQIVGASQGLSEQARLRVAAAEPPVVTVEDYERVCGALTDQMRRVTGTIISHHHQLIADATETAARLYAVVKAMYPNRTIYRYPAVKLLLDGKSATEAVATSPHPTTSHEEQQLVKRPREFLMRIPRGVASYWESLKGKGKSNRLIAVATVVIAFAGAATWWEAYSSGKQTEKIIAADERLAHGIENVFAQANNSLKASIEASRMDQRAWVGVVKLNSFNFRVGPNFSIPFDVVNSGKTPALNVRTKTALKSVENGNRFIPMYQEPTMVPSLGVIQPQVHSELTTLPVDISASQFGDIKNGRGTLYAYGRIDYDDIFGRPHETTFCVKYSAGNTIPIQCDAYNAAD